MSESTIEQVANAISADNSQGQPAEPESQPAGTGTTEPELSEFAQGVLKDIPELERPIVQKYISEWDKQVNQRFQGVHSEYESWKPFKEAGYDPQEVQQLIALGEALNANPAETIQAIIEAYNYQVPIGQGAPQPQPAGTGLPPVGQPVATPEQAQQFAQLSPEVQQRLALVDTMAQLLLAQQQQTEAQSADQELETSLAQMKQTHGEFDEKWVLTLAMQTGDLEQAVKDYKALEAQLMQKGNEPNSKAPVIIGAGGGLPADGYDPTKLDSKQTKQLVTQMLIAGQQQNQ